MVEIETLIGSYAFPIVMCVWFMIRTEKVMTQNTKATEDLSKIIIAYCEKK